MPSPVREKGSRTQSTTPRKKWQRPHRQYNPPLVRNDSRDGINHLLYAKMAQPPLVRNDGVGNVSYVLPLPLRGMGNGKIKTPRRSVV